MALDTVEKVEKTIFAIKSYHDAVKRRNKADVDVQDKLSLLKNASGANSVEEAVTLIGWVQVHGLPETR